MGTIEIVNKHVTSHGVYIGRPSALGNPYVIGPSCTRAQAIAAYRTWLRVQWKVGGEAKEALVRLARLYKEQQQLTLVCWCTPLACHGDVVAEAIRGIIEKGLV